MKEKKQKKCSKICWELMELVEHQAAAIRRLSSKIKELEALLETQE